MKRTAAIVEAGAVVLIVVGAAVAASLAFPFWTALFSLAAVLMVLAVVYPFTRQPYGGRLDSGGARRPERPNETGDFGNS